MSPRGALKVSRVTIVSARQFSTKLSRALNLHLSGSDLEAAPSALFQFSLAELLPNFITQSEPKMLCFVADCQQLQRLLVPPVPGLRRVLPPALH